jgi:hypothetical protein
MMAIPISRRDGRTDRYVIPPLGAFWFLLRPFGRKSNRRHHAGQQKAHSPRSAAHVYCGYTYPGATEAAPPNHRWDVGGQLP